MKNNRVLLINPPRSLMNYKIQFISPPLGLAYIAAMLERENIEVSILDTIAEGFYNIEIVENDIYKCGLSWKEIEQRIREYKPDIIGVSCMFTARFANTLEITKIAKRVNKNIKTVLGGMHSSTCPQQVLQHDSIDFVIVGEGERSFLSLIRQLGSSANNFSKIKGLGYQNKRESIINPEKDFIEELDEIPLPARHLLPMEKYFQINTGRDSLSTEKRQTSMITSRGCPYHCTFCSTIALWGRKWRKRSVENVLQEIEQLIRKYKVKEISFEDDNLTLDRDRFEKICQGIIERRFKIKWNTPNGIAIKNLDHNLIKLMRKSGCKRLNFGIESGDKYILNKVIKKELSLNRVKQVIAWCNSEGIVTLGYFVLGMPGETKESMRRTIDFAKELSLDEIGVFIATPFPGTELYRQCVEKKYLRRNYTDILTEDGIENEILFETPFLSTQDLLKYKSIFYSEFYKIRFLRNPFYYSLRALKRPQAVLRFLKESLVH